MEIDIKGTGRGLDSSGSCRDQWRPFVNHVMNLLVLLEQLSHCQISKDSDSLG
jgi:hypothetical protein